MDDESCGMLFASWTGDTGGGVKGSPQSSGPPTQEEIMKDLENPKMPRKIEGVEKAIRALASGESQPKIMMHIIRFCITADDNYLQKLLMLYWEIVPKYNGSPNNKQAPRTLKPEMILVGNAFLKALEHPNEYIRGCMLRFLCRLKEVELLEPLKDAIKANLEHRHSFVRRNAVMTVSTVYRQYGERLIPDAPELIEKVLLKETDSGVRRYAFQMLFDCAQDVAVTYLMNNMDQVPKFGDGFALVILELTRKVCRQDPSQKGRFLKCISQLLNSSSPGVRYEASWTLITLSSAPTAVRAAAQTYAVLLNTQSDNNVKLIVLDRLSDLKKHHIKILQEILMDIMRALNSPSLIICKRVLDIAMDLVSPRNIEEVVGQLKREVIKTQDKSRDNTGEYRYLLIQAIHACAIKFPAVASQVVHLLMEFLSSDGAYDVITFVRAMCETYPEMRSSILQKLIITFDDITVSKVYRVALWILGEYSSESFGEADDISLSSAFNTIINALGPLPFSLAPAKEESPEDEIVEAKPVTKSVVLADGTYATETSYDAPKKTEVEDSIPPLRKLILSGDSHLTAAVVSTLTKLCIRAIKKNATSTETKNMVVEAMKYMCEIVLFCESPQNKIGLDRDVKRRIYIALASLADPSVTEVVGDVLSEECRASFKELLETQKKDTEDKSAGEEPLAEVDDLISFRPLRGKKALGSTDIDIDDGADISRATGTDSANEYSGKLQHVHQLTGFADPVYAEAVVNVHDYDILLDIKIINRLPQTLNNLSVELSTLGDLKVVERPQPLTIGPLDERNIRANIKVSSTETGHIFGNIVYDSNSGAEKTYVNLNGISLDIMDYITPATCSDSEFRSMWAEFEWENKVAVNTEISNVFEFLDHIVEKTKMRCMTPTSNMGGDTSFLAANLYAKSIFGEDALANFSVEKQNNGRICGYIRIRSKTQGIALSLGDRITAVQRGKEKKSSRKPAVDV